jgi:formylglycine-generating enzyme required for sulfatase activity
MLKKFSRLLAVAVLAALPSISQAADKLEHRVETIPGTTVKFELVKLPPGKVTIKPGREAEPVTAEVKNIWIGKHEVTWDEYDIFAFGLDIPDEKAKQEAVGKTRPSKPYAAPDYGFGHNGYPCMSVHYRSAEAYCTWLSQKAGKKYRLPTEAEWEYAARGGVEKPEPMDEEALKAAAWTVENALEGVEEKPETADGSSHPVGKKAPNGYGLYDMIGNVAEWVHNPDPDQKPITKGGSWKHKAAAILKSDHPTAYRQQLLGSWQQRDPQDPKSTWWLSDGPHIGFRVVCEE